MQYEKTDKNQLRVVETIPEKQVEKLVDPDFLVNREAVLLKELAEIRALKVEAEKLGLIVDNGVETDSVDVVK